MRLSLEITLYIGVRLLCASAFTWYMIDVGPSFWEGLFTLSILALLCVGVDSIFRNVFFERAAFDYLSNVDFIVEVGGNGIAIDKSNHQVVAANQDWVIALDAINILEVTLAEENDNHLLVIESYHDIVPRLTLDFQKRRDARTEAYERLRMMVRIYRGSRLRERSPEPVSG